MFRCALEMPGPVEIIARASNPEKSIERPYGSVSVDGVGTVKGD